MCAGAYLLHPLEVGEPLVDLLLPVALDGAEGVVRGAHKEGRVLELRQALQDVGERGTLNVQPFPAHWGGGGGGGGN